MKKTLFIICVIVIGIGINFTLKNKSEKKSQQYQDIQMVNKFDTASLKQDMIQGEVKYIAQKVFFGKPTQEVIGTTSDITGEMNYTEGILNGDISVSTAQLTTDSEMRDNDVRKLLGTTIQVHLPDTEVAFPFTQTISVEMTINNVTQIIPFEITGSKGENGISLLGNADITMSSFSIEAPSIANIYTVDDEITLTVDFLI